MKLPLVVQNSETERDASNIRDALATFFMSAEGRDMGSGCGYSFISSGQMRVVITLSTKVELVN